MDSLKSSHPHFKVLPRIYSSTKPGVTQVYTGEAPDRAKTSPVGGLTTRQLKDNKLFREIILVKVGSQLTGVIVL